MKNVVLSVLAHPDDAEFLCTGTMIRLQRERGWEVHIASMTPGDCGSAEMGPEEISRVRRGEGAAAAAVIGATYHCLEERDLTVCYNEGALKNVTALLRKVRPRLVITHSPTCYMLDHEMTSQLARAACFAAPPPAALRFSSMRKGNRPRASSIVMTSRSLVAVKVPVFLTPAGVIAS